MDGHVDGQALDRQATLLEKAAAADAAQVKFASRAARTSKPQPAAEGQSLYADHQKVYPKKVSGPYRRAKWLVLAFCLAVYYLVPWIRWDRGPDAPGQAVLVDLGAPRAYFFGIEIWPQEVYFITGLLVLGALGLFLVTSLFGRLWCGYACPQTVWTDLFLWVERVIEGDRGARMRLDNGPLTAAKVVKKGLKHAAWLLISIATGGAWILYFSDAPTFMVEFFTGAASAQAYFFVGLLTSTTYILAGWAREQVCTYMCPWPRFQAAMLDTQSMVVTYEGWRGEPRGKTKAGAPPAGRGDCVDCAQCIAACPTGIDIRDGMQLECIGCGLCIDACNEIMVKMGRPAGLIQFDTLANLESRQSGKGPVRWKLLRPRTLIYAGLITVVSAVMLAALLLRTTLEVNVLRDRAPLYVTLSDGEVRNGFTLKLLNKKREALGFLLTVDGIKDATLVVQDIGQAAGGEGVKVHAAPDTVETFRVFVIAPKSSLSAESTPITFRLAEPDSGDTARYDGVFLGPHGPRK
ncbi:cytochrome c oxidase accessory protein CcoG [Aerophototrophica crusticola]|uniref:Cytochrome c oxidase accessory protein CcoG n=1 Tax=Aerophototrophica crusticola TaxID=1709002 RepID=A0A858R5D1_9PROT|nr:cytochrome c oxidase accessory protein CcoG [Rhodospirillaceae bacterium B3]